MSPSRVELIGDRAWSLGGAGNVNLEIEPCFRLDYYPPTLVTTQRELAGGVCGQLQSVPRAVHWWRPLELVVGIRTE